MDGRTKMRNLEEQIFGVRVSCLTGKECVMIDSSRSRAAPVL